MASVAPTESPGNLRFQTQRHTFLVERFLDHVRQRGGADALLASDEVEHALGPLRSLARVDPDAERQDEWMLALSVLEACVLRLMRAVEHDARQAAPAPRIRVRSAEPSTRQPPQRGRRLLRVLGH